MRIPFSSVCDVTQINNADTCGHDADAMRTHADTTQKCGHMRTIADTTADVEPKKNKKNTMARSNGRTTITTAAH